MLVIVFIGRVLPDGNIFGTATHDEFTIDWGETQGVFKRFEYLSIPFSFSGMHPTVSDILKQAEEKGTSFNEELQHNILAQDISDEFLRRMKESPGFSRQVIDHLLSRVFVQDNILSTLPKEDSLENEAARVVGVWKKLADFYCIEGLVGGGGEKNPFLENETLIFARDFL